MIEDTDTYLSILDERGRAAAIVEHCLAAGHGELAAGFIRDGQTLTYVTARLAPHSKAVPPASSAHAADELRAAAFARVTPASLLLPGNPSLAPAASTIAAGAERLLAPGGGA